MLIKDRAEYAREGVHKGDTGTIMLSQRKLNVEDLEALDRDKSHIRISIEKKYQKLIS